eukprot:3886201-Karenia_brevis.AAC.1
MEVDGATKDLRDNVKSLEKELKDLKALPSSLHSLCQTQGGHLAAVELLEGKLEEARAQIRDARPLESRRASAEAYRKKTAKELEQADASLAALRKESEELKEKIKEQEEQRQKKAVAHESAKKKVADLAGELAAMPTAASTMPAFEQEELGCLTDILKLVDGSHLEQVCRNHSIDPTLIVGRTTSLLAKVKAH